MSAPFLIACLVALRSEFDELAPTRDKVSDGWIGDTTHQAEPSDHNPDETGNTPYEDADNLDEVHAIDVDSDLRQSGWSMQRVVDVIVGRHRSGLDDRLNYVIYNRKIWASPDWSAREYTGTSPHTEHAHFSARYTTAQERDTRAWGLLEADMPSVDEICDEMMRRLSGSKVPITAKGLIQDVADKLGKDYNNDDSGIAQGERHQVEAVVRAMIPEIAAAVHAPPAKS